MLIVKSEHQLSTIAHRIFSVLSCHEVRPIVRGENQIIGLSCEVFGADNQTGESFERTIMLQGPNDPKHVFVENAHGKTIQSYHLCET